jgi:hypothetical protein
MELQPYQQRVVEEKADLDAKLERLCNFCWGPQFDALPVMERERLNLQRHTMTTYSAILGARIAAFGG